MDFPFKVPFLAAAASALAVAVARARSEGSEDGGAGLEPSREPFALVELFTSEGCSSCPPADALLSQAGRVGVRREARIFPLAFHVDYWDSLGWRDRYAARAFTNRQTAYARTLAAGVYTPQVVVNGTAAFVGSDRGAMADAASDALSRRAEVGVAARAEFREEEAVVRYRLSGRPEGAVLFVALAESGLASEVTRGENGGRTLRHDHVVRLLQSLKEPPQEGEIAIPLPPEVRRERTEVVAFVQDARSFRVLGAARAKLM